MKPRKRLRASGRPIDPVARSGLLSMAALIVLGGTRVLYGAMVSRVTDRETFGMIGVLISVTMIASFLVPSGVASAISRFVPYHIGRGDISRGRGLWRMLSLTGIVGGAILGVAAAAVVSILMRRTVGEAMEVALLTFVYSLYTIDKAAMYAFGLVSSYLRVEVIGSGITLSATVILIATGWTSYLTPFILGYGAFVVASRWSVSASLRGDVSLPSWADRAEALGYIALASLGILASAGYLQATQLLAARFATPAELAYFTAAITLIAPMYFLPRALGMALFPFMAGAHGAGDVAEVRRHADIATRALLVLLAPMFVVAELLSEELLMMFGGSQYIAGASVLQMILAAAYLAVVQVASVNALSSGPGWQLRTPVAWSVAGCVAGLAAVTVLGGLMGAAGVGLAYLVGTLVTASGPIVVVWRRYGMPWLGPFSRAVLTVAAALGTARFMTLTSRGGPGDWVGHLAIAAVGFAVTVVVLRRDLVAIRDEVRGTPEPRTAEGASTKAGATISPVGRTRGGPSWTGGDKS